MFIYIEKPDIKKKKDEIKEFIESLKTLRLIDNEKRILKSINT